MIRTAAALAPDDLLLVFEVHLTRPDGPASETVVLMARRGQKARQVVLCKPMARVIPDDVRCLNES